MDHRRQGRPERRSPPRRASRTVVLALALGLGGLGAAGASSSFEGQGRVTAVDPGRGTVTLEHSGIEGLFPAGRSEFPVGTGVSVMRGVRPGDRVRFTLEATDQSHGLLTVVSLAPETPEGIVWSDHLLTVLPSILSLLTLATAALVGVLLWRHIQALTRRVVALDHEASLLRGVVADTQDGVRQIARTLEEATTTLRVGYVRELRRRLGPLPAAGASEARPAVEAPGALVVVQRGRGELFSAVQSEAAGGWTVIWDRRRGERRTGGLHPVGHERRRSERRASPPETWTRLGFHLIPESHAEPPRNLRSVRSVGGERGAAR